MIPAGVQWSISPVHRSRPAQYGQRGQVVLIFPHSGGHLSKLGMIRAEVKDGSESAAIHG
jgi:hypothetical protein